MGHEEIAQKIRDGIHPLTITPPQQQKLQKYPQISNTVILTQAPIGKLKNEYNHQPTQSNNGISFRIPLQNKPPKERPYITVYDTGNTIIRLSPENTRIENLAKGIEEMVTKSGIDFEQVCKNIEIGSITTMTNVTDRIRLPRLASELKNNLPNPEIVTYKPTQSPFLVLNFDETEPYLSPNGKLIINNTNPEQIKEANKKVIQLYQKHSN